MTLATDIRDREYTKFQEVNTGVTGIRATSGGYDSPVSSSSKASITFADSATTATGGLSLVGTTTAQYNDEIVLSIPASPTQVTTNMSSGKTKLLATGFTATGQDTAILINIDNPRVFIRTPSAVTTILTQVHTHSKPAINDITAGQTGSGNTAEDADWIYEPTGARIYNGLYVVFCGARKYDGSGSRTDSANWPLVGMAVLHSATNDGLNWTLDARDTGGGATSNVTMNWSCNLYPLSLSGTGQSTVYAAFTNYRNAKDTSGENRTYLMKYTLSAGTWTAGKNIIIHAQTLAELHYHCAVAYRFGASGLAYLWIEGDSLIRNCIKMVSRSDENYDTGFVDPGGDYYNTYTTTIDGTNGWNTTGAAKAVVHGSATVGSNAKESYQSTQMLRTSSRIYMCSDEDNESIMSCQYPSTHGEILVFRGEVDSGSRSTGGVGVIFLIGSVNDWDSPTPRMCFLGTQSQATAWTGNTRERTAMIYYMKDSTEGFFNYGSLNLTEASGIGMKRDGTVICGTNSSTVSQGVWEIPAPDSTYTASYTPLISSPGGSNVLKTGYTYTSFAGATLTGLTPTDVEDIIQVELPNDPNAQNYEYTEMTFARTGGNSLGTIAGPGPDNVASAPTTSVQLSMWIRPLLDDLGGVRYRVYDSGSGVGQATGYTSYLNYGSNEWHKVNFELSPSTLASAFRPGIQPDGASESSVFTQGYMLMAVRGVYIDPSGFIRKSIAPNSTEVDDRWAIKGLNCRDSWTIRAQLMFPSDGPDKATTLITGTSLLARIAEDSGKFVDFISDRANSNMEVTYNENGTTQTADATNPDSDAFEWARGRPVWVGIKKSGTTITYYASVGASRVTSGTFTATTNFRPQEVRFFDGSNVVANVDICKIEVDRSTAQSGSMETWSF